MEEIIICTPQFDREQPLDFPFVPTNAAEFYNIINNASWQTLKSMGFSRWDKWNEVVSENKRKDAKMVVLPVFTVDQLPDVLSGEIVRTNETVLLDLTPKEDLPTDIRGEDLWICLFPAEWYSIIPNGFMLTGLYGEQYPFEKGKSDDDTRYGCLPYGILRNLPEQTLP
jgi:hypothetical protein